MTQRVIDTASWKRVQATSNLLERDLLLKRAMGVPEASFTRLGEMLFS